MITKPATSHTPATPACTPAGKLSTTSETNLFAILSDLGYNDEAAYTYITDAKRARTVHLLGREKLQYNRGTGKFTLVIPAVHDDSYEEAGCCDTCGEWRNVRP